MTLSPNLPNTQINSAPSPFGVNGQQQAPTFTPPQTMFAPPPSPNLTPVSSPATPSIPQVGTGQEQKDLLNALSELTEAIKEEGEKQDAPVSPFAPSTQQVPTMQPARETYTDARGRLRYRDTGRFAPSTPSVPSAPSAPSVPSDPSAPSAPSAPSNVRMRQAMYAGRNLYGASSLEGAFSQVPYIGGLLSQGLGQIRSFGMQASAMELPAIQAQNMFLNQSAGGRAFPSMQIRSHVNNLSSRLGISPQQAVNTLKNVGMAQGNNAQLGVRDIEGLTLMGFDPTSIAGMAGQLGAFGVQGDVLRAMGGAQAGGLRGGQQTQFAQSVVQFATGRIQSGLGSESIDMITRRAGSMGPNLMANMQTMQRAQGISIRSAGGLTSAFSGVVDATLQAYAMQEAGGDLMEATRILEDMTGEEMYLALQESGMDERTAKTMLTAGGQLTTRDVERIASQEGVTAPSAPRLELEKTQRRGLQASRSFAQKQQRDLSIAFSTPKGSSESVLQRLETLLQQETKFQQSQLAKIPDSQMIKGLSDAMIAFNDSVNAVAVPTLKVLGQGLSELNVLVAKALKMFSSKPAPVKANKIVKQTTQSRSLSIHGRF